MKTRYFDLNGQVVSIESNTDTVATMIQTRPLRSPPLEIERRQPDLAFRIVERAPSPVPPKRGAFQNDDVQFVARERFSIVSNLARRPWTVDIVTYDYRSDDLFYCLFLPVLFSCLMRRGQILWHCAGVTSRGRSVLIPANARGGKSTTALTLVDGGFDFLADDNVFLLLNGAGVDAASSDPELFLRKPSVERLSESATVAGGEWTFRGQEEKKRIDMGRRRGTGGPFPIDMVLFPSISGRHETTLTPLSPSEATMMCLALGLAAKNPIAIFRDRLAYEKQLEIYTRLASTARCYRLSAGTDPASLVDCVRREFDRA